MTSLEALSVWDAALKPEPSIARMIKALSQWMVTATDPYWDDVLFMKLELPKPIGQR